MTNAAPEERKYLSIVNGHLSFAIVKEKQDPPPTLSLRRERVPDAPPRRRFRRWLVWIIALLLAWFVIHVAVMLWYGFSDDTRLSDVGVVLGNLVEPDGTPGKILKARLDRAVELFNAGVFRHVIVSGAVYPPESYDEPAGMKRYLVEHGVPADAIITDPGGANTYLTGLDTRRIMREHGWHSVTIVTHYYHILRTRYAFDRWGITGVRTVHARLGTGADEPYRVLREFVAFYRYVFRFYPDDAPRIVLTSS